MSAPSHRMLITKSGAGFPFINWLPLLFLVIVLGASTLPGIAAVFPRGYLRTQVMRDFVNAEVVLTGRVAYHWSNFDPVDQLIYTYALVEVESVTKGSPSDRVITVAVLGGKVGRLRLTHSTGNVQFADGEQAEFMLRFDPVRSLYLLVDDPFGYRSLGDGIIKPRGRIQEFTTIFGFGWGAGAQIKYRVNVTDNLPGGVTGAQFLAAIHAAVLVWQQVANVSWSYRGTSSRTALPGAPDGDGTIHFFWQTSLGGGAIGVARTWSMGSQIIDSDVAFDRDQIAWSTSPSGAQGDVQSVAAHESGHSIGLGHSSETFPEPNPVLAQATMYFSVTLGTTTARDLNSDDIAGIRSLYGAMYRRFLPLLQRP